jgi:acid phosphatase type 7
MLLVAVCLLADCGGHSASLPTEPTPSRTTATSSLNSGISTAPFTLVGAGDIAMCGYLDGAYMTAALLDKQPGTVFTMGDDAQLNGTADEYRNCYAPTWGRQLDRTRPSPGNHDYASGGGAYYDYFGGRAGQTGLGYYSYSIGNWTVYSLNSEVPSQEGSPQAKWLELELAEHRSPCTLAYWHRPRFSSGRIGNNEDMQDLWRLLSEFHADVVVNGHDHFYERFAPQDEDGKPDPAGGIREFIVGTGGAPLSGISKIQPNSEVRANTWGVIVFTLVGSGYEWRFISAGNSGFSDAGSGSCH